MAKHDWIKQFVAGLFFIVSITLIAGVIFVIGVERGFTEPKFTMTAYFREVGGLGVGAPVRLSGVTVGNVENIDFLENDMQGRSVEVTLLIYEKYREQLHKSVRIAIITEGVLGEKIVEITTDPRFWRQDLSNPIIGVDPLDVLSLAEKFGDAASALSDTSDSIDTIIGEMRVVTMSIKRILNRVEQRIIEGNLFKVF